jgi:hypothetical protein
VDEPSPLLLVPAWDRPRGRGFSSHHRAVLDAPGWAEPILVLLPATDLDSLSGASFRTQLLAHWHLDLVLILSDILPKVHSEFEVALLMLHAGGEPDLPIHLFKASRARTPDHTLLLQELSRLLVCAAARPSTAMFCEEFPTTSVWALPAIILGA